MEKFVSLGFFRRNGIRGRRRHPGIDNEHQCSRFQNEAIASVPDVSEGSGIFP